MLYEFETFEKYKLPQDYWNEHKRVFEVEKDGINYVITPELTGYSDGRCCCYIWSEKTGKEYVLGYTNNGGCYCGERHFNPRSCFGVSGGLSDLGIPVEFIDIVNAAWQLDPNFWKTR